jgi:hypothetical protein
MGQCRKQKGGDNLERNREQYREPEDTVATTDRGEATRLLHFFYHNRAATFICLASNPFDRMPGRFVEPITTVLLPRPETQGEPSTPLHLAVEPGLRAEGKNRALPMMLCF